MKTDLVSTSQLSNDFGGALSVPQLKKRIKQFGINYKATGGEYLVSRSDFLKNLYLNDMSSSQKKKSARDAARLKRDKAEAGALGISTAQHQSNKRVAAKEARELRKKLREEEASAGK